MYDVRLKCRFSALLKEFLNESQISQKNYRIYVGVAVCAELLGPYEKSATCIGATDGGGAMRHPTPQYFEERN
jgi:hypothetical protein